MPFKKLTLSDMHRFAEDRGGQCLSTVYVNNDTNLQWKCGEEDHPPWYATPGSIKAGKWCRKCSLSRYQSQRKIELLRILAEGCRKHPGYRARRAATGRCMECVIVWQARLELNDNRTSLGTKSVPPI